MTADLPGNADPGFTLMQPQAGDYVSNAVYEESPKHHPNARGNISGAPTNGQSTLNGSIQIRWTSPRRIGFDRTNSEIVIFDQTTKGVFHGHVRTWGELNDRQKNVLIKNGTHNRKGKVIE